MNEPLVSVIMAVYNTNPKQFKSALESIIRQTYTNLEIIIVNDASTMNYEFVKDYCDERIIWIDNERNMGLTFSLNRALLISEGKYIARMDSDDISFENRIRKQVEYLEKNKDIAILGTRAKEFDGAFYVKASIPNKPSYIKAYSLFNCSIVHPSVMIRKEFLDTNKLTYNEEYRNSQDFDLWARCMAYGDVVGELPECLLYYRISENQISSKSNNSQQKANARRIREYQIELLGLHPSEKEINIHNSISEGVFSQNYEFIDIKKWCIKILNANKNVRYYNEKMLKLAIAQQIFPVMFAEKFTVLEKIKNFCSFLPVVGLFAFEAIGAKLYRSTLGVTVKEYDCEI